MSREIEEMAKILCGMKNGCDGCMWDKLHCNERNYAEEIYNAGYRKQSEGEWISVDDRLPEERVMVLGYVVTDYGDCYPSDCIYVMELIHGLFYPFNCSAIKGYSKVTHWMPLPEPPKMRKEDEGK
jgi:hypothetical protein